LCAKVAQNVFCAIFAPWKIVLKKRFLSKLCSKGTFYFRTIFAQSGSLVPFLYDVLVGVEAYFALQKATTMEI
jgi:hypothetical protein